VKFHVMSTLRSKSSRCPNKLLRPFAGTTLLEIFAPKMRALGGVVEVPADDPEIQIAAEACGLEMRLQTKPGLEGLFSTLEDVVNGYVVWVNPCQPFLCVATVLGAIEIIRDRKCKALTTVRPEYNWFWDANDKSAMNNRDPRVIATQESPPILSSTHSVHIFQRELMVEAGMYWTLSGPDDPYLYEIRRATEVLDVDDEEDFLVAEAVYAAQCK